MTKGYARYRAIGIKDMRLRAIRTTILDDKHCIAHVEWTATYLRKDRTTTEIAFKVHYLVQFLDDGPRVFGWVSGDEQALLLEHGIT